MNNAIVGSQWTARLNQMKINRKQAAARRAQELGAKYMAKAEDARRALDNAKPRVDEYNRNGMALMKGTLEKAGAVVGNPTQGQVVVDSPFAALIPQDIAPYWYSQVAPERKRIALLNYLNQVKVNQRFREKVVVTRHTDHMIPSATSEAGIPGISDSTIDKRIATTRWWRELRSITHPAMNVTILGAQYPVVQARGKGGLQFEQREGSLGLAEKMEIAYWHGDNDANPEEGDGFFKQVRDGGVTDVNYYDLRGGQLSFSAIIEALAKVSQDGFEGEPDTLFLPGPVWASISAEATQKNRLDPERAKVGEVMWNRTTSQLFLIGPSGTPIGLKEARLLVPQYFNEPPAAGGGEFESISTGDLSAGSPTTPVDADSQFGADDAGTYSYRVSAVFAQGYSAAISINNVTVAAGDGVLFEWDDAAIGTSSNPLLGYRVWRNSLDAPTKFGLIGFFGKNTDSADNGTAFVDLNDVLPGTFRCGATHGADGAISDDVLLDTNMVTLGQFDMALRMVVNRYSSLDVNMPRKQLAFTNVGGFAGV